MVDLRDYQIDTLAFLDEFQDTGRLCVGSPTGSGKCLGAGTNILLFDGTLKKVEDINTNDLLMGDDSTARRVLSLARGQEQMYKIKPVKGLEWTCNGSHILSLICNDDISKAFRKNLIYDISVNDYLNLPKSVKHCLKLYRVPIKNFKNISNLILDPYFLGLLLGDGTMTRSVGINTPDPEIIEELEKQAPQWNCTIRKDRDLRSKSDNYYFPTLHDSRGCRGGNNELIEVLKQLNIYGKTAGNKFIPFEYKTASFDDRLQILAGLIDTDGFYDGRDFEFSSKSHQLAEDVCFIARSLGFRAYKKEKIVKGQLYFRFNISGNLDQIPTKIARKKASPRRQIKDVLRTGFEIQKLGIDDFFGFEIDGNRRFLLEDCTVTHNTVIFSYFAASQLVKEKKTLILVHRKELLEQTRKIFANQFNYHPTLIIAGQKTVFQEDQSIYLGMVETVFRREKLLKELRENIDNLIIDECHIFSFVKLVDGFKRVIGFTATPQIIKKDDSLKNYFHEFYEVTSVPKLIEEGHLIKPTTYAPQDLVLKAKSMTLSTSMGDYKESDQEREIDKIYSDVIDAISKYKEGRTLIFHPTISLSQKVSKTLTNLGYESYHLDGETPSGEREFIKQRLKHGTETIVNNCGVLTTGFDEPLLETIVLNRLTKSENLFIQMVGRGSRTAPEIYKDGFVLLDLYGNSVRLGLWQSFRDWHKRFESIKESKDGEAPVKICPRCDAVVPAPTKICPHCGHEFQKQKEEQELKQAQELAILRESTIREKAKEVMDLIREKGHKPFAALYKIVDFVYSTGKEKDLETIYKELHLGLGAWCKENKGDPKIRFNDWYKERIISIYNEKYKN